MSAGGRRSGSTKRPGPPERSGPPERPGPAERRDWRKVAIVVALLLVVAVVDILIFTGRGGRPEAEAVDRPDLRAEAVMGCYVLRVGPWNLASSGRAPADAAQPGSPSATRPGVVPDSLPVALEPPARVALLPDSADAHGRDLPSFRAEAIPEGERPGRVLRWTVRADTLWVVWSEPGGRAGLALFAEGDSLAGYARGVTDSVDASAPALAWQINCSTLARDRGAGRPRR